MTSSRDNDAVEGGVDRQLGHSGVLCLDVLPRMTLLANDGPERLPVELAAVVNVTEGFTPSLVATVNGYEGTRVPLLASVIDGLQRDLLEPRIIGISDWAAPASWETAEPGYVIDYLHRTTDGLLVAAQDVVAVSRGWAVQVTLTTTPQTRFILDDLLHDALSRITVERPVGPGDPVTVVTGGVPTVPSRVAGAPERPDISWLADQAAWTHADEVGLSARSLEYLTQLDAGTPLPASSSISEDLAGAGLLTHAGLTGDAVYLAQHLQQSDAGLTVTLHRAGEETTLTCAMVGETTAVIYGPSWGQRVLGHPGAANRDRSGAAVVATTELSAVICGWLGIGPAWVDDESPIIIGTSHLDAFANDAERTFPGLEDATPPGLWHISTWVGERTLDDTHVVHAGSRGQFLVRADTEDPSTVVLWPTDPAWLFRMIEDRVQAAFFDRAVTLDS